MPCLSEADQRAALELARQAIRDAVLHRKLPDVIPREGIFSQRAGVFVTLHVRGNLQGCIGVSGPGESLGEAIVRCAGRAGWEDHPFSPVEAFQLEEMELDE